MRVFFTGSQGVGKSTLVHEASKFLPSFEIFDSMSRLFISEGNKNVQKDYRSREYIDFQRKILLYCLNFYINNDNFITSRSLFDSYAYLEYAYSRTIGESNHSYIKSCLDMVDNYSDLILEPKDNIIFYIPIEFPIDNNNSIRITDPIFQRDIDKLLQKYIKLSNYNSIVTLTGSIEDRLEKIRSIVC